MRHTEIDFDSFNGSSANVYSGRFNLQLPAGMSWLAGLFTTTKLVDKGLDIVDQFITDKDKAAELKAAFYLQELKTSTIPIIDAIHKMGRQTLAFTQMGFYFYTMHRYGVESITPELVAGVSGAASIYTLVKGKGR